MIEAAFWRWQRQQLLLLLFLLLLLLQFRETSYPFLTISVLIRVQIFSSKKEAASVFGSRHISRPITVVSPQLSITLCECGISDTGYRLID